MSETCNHDSGSLFFHILMRPIIDQVSAALLELPHVIGVSMVEKWHLRGGNCQVVPLKTTALWGRGRGVYQGLPAYKRNFVSSPLSLGALA